jgi:hypothetical protein
MSTPWAIATAVTFVWLGMVLAISFLEAPIKFQAPGVTVPIGLGIGRLVFRALNAAEAAFAVALVVVALLDSPGTTAVVAGAVAIASLAAQLAAVRPGLSRRTRAVLAGQDAPRSHAHHDYVALELVKVVALLVAGVALVSA